MLAYAGLLASLQAPHAGSWVDIPPGEDPAGPVGGQQQAMQGQRSLKARGKGMISMLGRKMQKEDPLKELTALGYHEDDCRVRTAPAHHTEQ